MKKIITLLIVLSTLITAQAQEYSFIPKGLKEISIEELMQKGEPKKLDLVFYADGTKTTLKEVKPLIMSGAVFPKMFVDKKGNYKALVIIGGRYSFLPNGLKPISMTEVQQRGVPKKLDLVFFEDGTKTTLKDAVKLIREGKAMPNMFVDKQNNYKALVVLMYKDTSDPYENIKNPTGEKAKEFSIKTIDGKEYSLKSLKGKKIVLNFWFVNCLPCVKEIPVLNELTKKYKNNNNVVFLAITYDKKSTVKKFLKKKEFKYQIVSGKKDLCDLYNVKIYPTHLVIDENSKIEYFAIGSEKKIIKEIEEIITK